ncbi:MAG: four helix bundle protein [Gemmatimonadales bacterium]|nr:four helix bundle protein [Gemmatimonadales bacterium]NIN11785.1 four helix bundle protein [Gemmatimonadales bacterium]NIN50341.1 four helix bundle protein [Gemmatimonadales bacterium]NIP07805.1 four helix bundle protein [Gemmatimonadales bacterium]NIQ99237.1 four helix bundle protein [Gemmatimonadales bacterium]
MERRKEVGVEMDRLAMDWLWLADRQVLGLGIMMPYGRLDAWQVCHQLVLEVYGASRTFPDDERYGLTAQARRAAFSSAANIAEGSAKRGAREFRRFLDIALGSLSELSYILLLSENLGYLTREAWERLNALRDRAGKLTWRLYESLGKRPRRTNSRA